MFASIQKNKDQFIILTVVALAFSLIYLDMTTLSVALPSIQKGLNTSTEYILWVVNIYMLIRAILVFASGRLSDMFGHAQNFTFGLIVYACSSLLCALATNITWLILFRFFQGIGAAFIFVPGMSLVTSNLPEQKIGRGIGLVVSVGLASMAAGPLLSGLIINYSSWRVLFIVNVIISFIALVLLKTQIKPQKKTVRCGKFDSPGFVLSSIFTVCITVAFENSNSWGWVSWKFIIMALIAIAALILFFVFEKKQDEPIVDLKLFALPNFFVGCLIASFVQISMLTIIFIGVFLQNALGFSPLRSGFLLLPMVAGGIVFANVGGYLADHYGARFPLIMGTLLIFIGFFLTLCLFQNISYYSLLPLLVLTGIGMSMISGPVRTAMIYQTPKNKHGMTNSILTGIRSIISVIGFAIISAIIGNVEFVQAKLYLSNLLPSLTSSQVQSLEGLLSYTAKSHAILAQYDPNIQSQIKNIILQSYINGFFWSLVFIGVLIFISFILAVKYIKQPSFTEQTFLYSKN